MPLAFQKQRNSSAVSFVETKDLQIETVSSRKAKEMLMSSWDPMPIRVAPPWAVWGERHFVLRSPAPSVVSVKATSNVPPRPWKSPTGHVHASGRVFAPLPNWKLLIRHPGRSGDLSVYEPPPGRFSNRHFNLSEESASLVIAQVQKLCLSVFSNRDFRVKLRTPFHGVIEAVLAYTEYAFSEIPLATGRRRSASRKLGA